ncbi:helix-turn-helix transcriptional regulator [Rhabdothermincola sediminis]|uniref:helix-turn-helix transcriptional regulator n=1 Tax=Rhabdothermincola sediminis TaxID=2751370 RepID=UPI0027D9F686|nr:winged helix-turn-helix transcriptional regulator [Rhabdothermincola sediminis]
MTSTTANVAGPATRPDWTFLTNHAHVLLCISADPQIRQRDIARLVGITERAAQKIVSELEAGGYLVRERVGRRNHYRIDRDLPLRHPLESAHRIGELIDILRPELPLER